MAQFQSKEMPIFSATDLDRRMLRGEKYTNLTMQHTTRNTQRTTHSTTQYRHV